MFLWQRCFMLLVLLLWDVTPAAARSKFSTQLVLRGGAKHSSSSKTGRSSNLNSIGKSSNSSSSDSKPSSRSPQQRRSQLQQEHVQQESEESLASEAGSSIVEVWSSEYDDEYAEHKLE